MVFLQIRENDICQQYSASHTASEIIQLAKHIRRMGVSTVVIGSNIIIRPTPRNMKETTYDRKKQKINKI
jgi:phosphate uptake regulator